MCEKEVPEWKSEEWKRIGSRRERAFGWPIKTEGDSVEKVTEPKNLVGLSLSGGGIRSAVYNDGFLQGLSHRGFLRYVDYLCSVSGGGYIAGHLISQAREPGDEGGKCFHDDEERRNLGRDPVTGKVNARRLAGVGGYLSRTFEFLPAYLWSFFFSFAFYIGMVGVVATLAALFWRSFDDPVFRTLYVGTLGLIKGNELTIAFIPAILLGVLATVSEVGLSSWRLFFGFDRPIAKRIHLIVRKASLVLVSLAILTSIAIFIGNGKTNVSSNAGGQLFLNNYGHFLAIAAGVIQILVFLSRDRLFRSERAEAKQWQKHLQRSVTTVVLLFLTFSMVHWMGRENISGYTQNRDPHLVRGDVTNWYVMDQLFASYEKRPGERPDKKQPQTELLAIRALDPLDRVPDYAKPASPWIAFLAAGRAGLGFDSWKPGDDLSQPPSPLQEVYVPQEEGTAQKKDASQEEGTAQKKDTLIVWSLPKRIQGAGIAYWLAMFCSDEKDVRQLHNNLNGPSTGGAKKSPQYLPFNDSQSVHEFVSTAFVNVQTANRIQDERLEVWNKYLREWQFAAFLIAEGKGVSKPNDLRSDSETTASAPASAPAPAAPSTSGDNPWQQFSTLVNLNGSSFTDEQKKSILKIVGLGLVEQPQERDDLPSQDLATAIRSRLLLEALLPDAVQEQGVPSTRVVPPHDQLARRRWLCLWAVLTLVGMIGGLGQNHIATVFQFYRQQLGLNFLVATHDPSRQFCDKQLYELHPTDDGLPYPLFLAATLEPTTCNGSYQVEAKPFVFSPLFCGRFDTADGQIPSKQLSFSSNPASAAVTLGDAITLSGAAVTPLMTGNRWLSIILDFFNTGIGQRLRRLDRTGNEIRRLWTRPIVISAIVILVAAIVARALIGLGPIMVVVIGLLTCLACYCIVMKVGSPGLISSLAFPRNRDGKNLTRDDGRSFYVADGGFCDYLGVSELLRRRCELIVVSDTGANIGNDPLGTLAQMCEKASQEMGIRFLDLDHEAPIDFGRLKLTEKRLVHQPYLCMRIRYPEPESSEGYSGSKPLEGRLFYCQMSITDNDPIEIQHIRNRFPSFPDEPTVNQFYTVEQVSAYRALGYHIANRLCNELQPWRDDATCAEIPNVDSAAEPPMNEESESKRGAGVERYRYSLVAGDSDVEINRVPEVGHELGQPLFDVLRERLLTAYRLACYEELSYRKDDIFSEAIWVSKTFAFPAFRGSVLRVISAKSINHNLPGRWLREYEHSADVRSAYRTAVIRDINELNSNIDCFCEVLWSAITKVAGDLTPDQTKQLLAAHLTNIATACQEIHSGRPHSTFQIGGRDKLISLCHSFSEVICRTFQKEPTNCVDAEKLFSRMDQLIAELIELERSVFQGGEHVTTISFAQCMSTMWGRIVRRIHETNGLEGDDVREQFAQILQNVNSVAYGKSAEETPLMRRFATEFQVTEIRHRLDVGLKRTRVRFIRDGLVKSWCIGYFKTAEIQAGLDFPTSPTDQDDQKIGRRKPSATKK